MGLRADSARPQRVSGSARTDSRRDESARNPIAPHVNFGDDSALSAFTRTQWTAAFTVHGRPPSRYAVCAAWFSASAVQARSLSSLVLGELSGIPGTFSITPRYMLHS